MKKGMTPPLGNPAEIGFENHAIDSDDLGDAPVTTDDNHYLTGTLLESSRLPGATRSPGVRRTFRFQVRAFPQ